MSAGMERDLCTTTVATSPEFQASLEKAAPQDIQMSAGMERDLCTTQWQLHLSSRPHWRRLLHKTAVRDLWSADDLINPKKPMFYNKTLCWFGERYLHNTVATSPEFQASLEKAAPQDIRM
ncbi:hypothetical protein J6590_101106 [Homalodisca vitripennis]|nr:hypothetical protein J6590_101106 [Homalodisca vitripennis]